MKLNSAPWPVCGVKTVSSSGVKAVIPAMIHVHSCAFVVELNRYALGPHSSNDKIIILRLHAFRRGQEHAGGDGGVGARLDQDE